MSKKNIIHANFLVKHERQLRVIQVPNNRSMKFYAFQKKIQQEFGINPSYKIFFHLESNGEAGLVSFDQTYFDEILKNIHGFGENNLINLRVNTIHSFIFTTPAGLPTQLSQSKRAAPSLNTGWVAPAQTQPVAVNTVVVNSNNGGSNAQTGQQNQAGATVVVPDNQDDEVDEWEDIAAAKVSEEPKIVVASENVSISVGAPIKKLVVAPPVVVHSNKASQPTKDNSAGNEANKTQSGSTGTKEIKTISPPDFSGLNNTVLQGYVQSDKFKAEVELYEKQGPTGAISGSSSVIQLQIKNIGQTKLNKTFGVYRIKGNTKFDKVPLPFIGKGKTKIVTIRPEFEDSIDRAICLLSLGYEESGQRRYFGPILKLQYNRHDTHLSLRFITEKEAGKVAKTIKKAAYNDVMSIDEIIRVKNLLAGLDYRSLVRNRYGGDVYNKFKRLRDKISGIDKVYGCELIKSNLIPFTLLLQYAERSSVLPGMLLK